jgi:hypothetical protein
MAVEHTMVRKRKKKMLKKDEVANGQTRHDCCLQ